MHLCLFHSYYQIGIQFFQYPLNLSKYYEMTGIVVRIKFSQLSGDPGTGSCHKISVTSQTSFSTIE